MVEEPRTEGRGQRTVSAARPRPADWPERLRAFIERRRGMPFRWGRNDCCLFAADWIVLLHGVDPAARLRGRYQSALSAARLVRDHIEFPIDLFGVGEWPDRMGFEACDCWHAQRGDLVSCVSTKPAEQGAGSKEQGDAARQFLGVCTGPRVAGPGRDGVVFIERAFWGRAWRL